MTKLSELTDLELALHVAWELERVDPSGEKRLGSSELWCCSHCNLDLEADGEEGITPAGLRWLEQFFRELRT